jgi:ubiquinone/menaquinone biosynthesis C-methylase UbiE
MDHLKRVADEFGRQAQTFEKWAEKTDGQVAPRFQAALGAAVGGHLLDVACGPGVVTAALAPGAASVVAFDATEEMIERARSRCAKAGLANVAFKCGDAENLPFADAQFDGVVTRLAIHHFADAQRALDEMFRVLRRGGIAVVVDIVSSQDPAESNLQNAIERLRDPSKAAPGTRIASSRNGWVSSTIPRGSNLCAPSSARWRKRAAPREWDCRSGTAGSCSSTDGVSSAQESRSDIERIAPINRTMRAPQIRCSSPRLRP